MQLPRRSFAVQFLSERVCPCALRPQLLLLLDRFKLSRGTSSTAIPQLAPPKVRLSSSNTRSFRGSAVGALHVKSWHTYAVALPRTARHAGLRLLCYHS